MPLNIRCCKINSYMKAVPKIRGYLCGDPSDRDSNISVPLFWETTMLRSLKEVPPELAVCLRHQSRALPC